MIAVSDEPSARTNVGINLNGSKTEKRDSFRKHIFSGAWNSTRTGVCILCVTAILGRGSVEKARGKKNRANWFLFSKTWNTSTSHRGTVERNSVIVEKCLCAFIFPQLCMYSQLAVALMTCLTVRLTIRCLSSGRLFLNHSPFPREFLPKRGEYYYSVYSLKQLLYQMNACNIAWHIRKCNFAWR